MGREPSVERRRRSRSRSTTMDQYGRSPRDRESKDEKEYGKALLGRDSSRDRRDRNKRRRERDNDNDDDNDNDHRRQRDRERERSFRRGSQVPEARSGGVDGDSRKTSQFYSQWPGAQSAISDNKRQSRWGTTVHDEYAAKGANAASNAASGDRGERSNGGVYGPADRGGGGGGRGTTDESWLEYRLKLRAEAKPPRGVWNISPSPPRRKVATIPEISKNAGKKKDPQRRSSSKKSRLDNTKREKRHDRSRAVPSQLDSSSSGHSSDSSSDSSSGDNDSNSDGNSDSNSDGNSDSESDSDKRSAEKKTSGKRKPSSCPPSVKNTGLLKAKDIKPASHASADSSPDEADIKTHDKPRLLPTDELDELDAAEAAQFKAEVQGHRHHEAKDRDSDDEAGPMPVPQLEELQGEGERGVNYGGALLPGEGAAIAQFVQKGLRIPRRGEVGWAGQEIEKLESSGYVMSGSRHARMNAVRLRKENQVFNAEERRALALIMFEEKQQKENEILGNFRQMLTEANREGEKKSTEGAIST